MSESLRFGLLVTILVLASAIVFLFLLALVLALGRKTRNRFSAWAFLTTIFVLSCFSYGFLNYVVTSGSSPWESVFQGFYRGASAFALQNSPDIFEGAAPEGSSPILFDLALAAKILLLYVGSPVQLASLSLSLISTFYRRFRASFDNAIAWLRGWGRRLHFHPEKRRPYKTVVYTDLPYRDIEYFLRSLKKDKEMILHVVVPRSAEATGEGEELASILKLNEYAVYEDYLDDFSSFKLHLRSGLVRGRINFYSLFREDVDNLKFAKLALAYCEDLERRAKRKKLRLFLRRIGLKVKDARTIVDRHLVRFYVSFQDEKFNAKLDFMKASKGAIKLVNEYSWAATKFVYKNPLNRLLDFNLPSDADGELAAKRLRGEGVGDLHVYLLGFGHIGQALLDRMFPSYQFALPMVNKGQGSPLSSGLPPQKVHYHIYDEDAEEKLKEYLSRYPSFHEANYEPGGNYFERPFIDGKKEKLPFSPHRVKLDSEATYASMAKDIADALSSRQAMEAGQLPNQAIVIVSLGNSEANVSAALSLRKAFRRAMAVKNRGFGEWGKRKALVIYPYVKENDAYRPDERLFASLITMKAKLESEAISKNQKDAFNEMNARLSPSLSRYCYSDLFLQKSEKEDNLAKVITAYKSLERDSHFREPFSFFDDLARRRNPKIADIIEERRLFVFNLDSGDASDAVSYLRPHLNVASSLLGVPLSPYVRKLKRFYKKESRWAAEAFKGHEVTAEGRRFLSLKAARAKQSPARLASLSYRELSAYLWANEDVPLVTFGRGGYLYDVFADRLGELGALTNWSYSHPIASPSTINGSPLMAGFAAPEAKGGSAKEKARLLKKEREAMNEEFDRSGYLAQRDNVEPVLALPYKLFFLGYRLSFGTKKERRHTAISPLAQGKRLRNEKRDPSSVINELLLSPAFRPEAESLVSEDELKSLQDLLARIESSGYAAWRKAGDNASSVKEAVLQAFMAIYGDILPRTRPLGAALASYEHNRWAIQKARDGFFPIRKEELEKRAYDGDSLKNKLSQAHNCVATSLGLYQMAFEAMSAVMDKETEDLSGISEDKVFPWEEDIAGFLLPGGSSKAYDPRFDEGERFALYRVLLAFELSAKLGQKGQERMDNFRKRAQNAIGKDEKDVYPIFKACIKEELDHPSFLLAAILLAVSDGSHGTPFGMAKTTFHNDLATLVEIDDRLTTLGAGPIDIFLERRHPDLYRASGILAGLFAASYNHTHFEWRAEVDKSGEGGQLSIDEGRDK